MLIFLVLLTYTVYRDARFGDCKDFLHFHFPTPAAKCHFVGMLAGSINQSSVLRSMSYKFVNLISKSDALV